VRIERAGDLFTASQSPDGASWTTVSTPKTVALSTEVLAGLAVSARNDNTVTTATFDNVTLTGSPALRGADGQLHQYGRFRQRRGGHLPRSPPRARRLAAVRTSAVFASLRLADFTFTARLLTQTGGNANAQAGVMVHKAAASACARYLGSVANAGSEFITRESSITNAFGSSIDYTLGSGLLNFEIGEQTKNLHDLDRRRLDGRDQIDNITITLRNPNGATHGCSLAVHLHDHRQRLHPRCPTLASLR